MMVKVSIITPSLNQGRFLEQTIRSVLCQDYPNLEYIIIDGGSSDDSVEMIKRYAGRLASWTSEPDRNHAEALCKGFRRATGDILAWMNSDDEYLPGAVRAAVEAFERTGADLVYGNVLITDEEGRVKGERRLTRMDGRDFLGLGNCLAQPATFWTRRIYDQVGGIDMTYEFQMDLDFYIRVAAVGRLQHVRRPLATMRLHSQGKMVKAEHVRQRELAIIQQRYCRRGGLERLWYSRAFLSGRQFIRLALQGDLAYAVRRLWQRVVRRTPVPATTPERKVPAEPTVTVVIPTKNRHDDLLLTVEALTRQTKRPQQLVIVDQSAMSCETRLQPSVAGCTEMTVKYLWAPEVPGLVAARIRGVRESTSDVVFFVDDDIALASDCIQRLVERYVKEPDVAGVCAVDTSCAVLPWWQVTARRMFTLGPFWDERSVMGKRHRSLVASRRVRFFSGGWMSYRRWVFDDFQFEDALWGHRWNGSIDFSYRVSARYPLVIDPLVRIVHRRPYGTYTPEEFVRVRVAGTWFFFARNVRKNLLGWAAFVWLMIGILLRGTVHGLATRSLGRVLRAYAQEVRNGIRFMRQPFAAPY